MGLALIRIVDPERKTKGKRPVEYFLIVSSVVNAPLTNGLSRKQMKTYLRERYGGQYTQDEWKRDLALLLKTGTTEGIPVEKFVLKEMYAAGPDGKKFTFAEFIQHWCRDNFGNAVAKLWITF